MFDFLETLICLIDNPEILCAPIGGFSITQVKTADSVSLFAATALPLVGFTYWTLLVYLQCEKSSFENAFIWKISVMKSLIVSSWHQRTVSQSFTKNKNHVVILLNNPLLYFSLVNVNCFYEDIQETTFITSYK